MALRARKVSEAFEKRAPGPEVKGKCNVLTQSVLFRIDDKQKDNPYIIQGLLYVLLGVILCYFAYVDCTITIILHMLCSFLYPRIAAFCAHVCNTKCAVNNPSYAFNQGLKCSHCFTHFLANQNQVDQGDGERKVAT